MSENARKTTPKPAVAMSLETPTTKGNLLAQIAESIDLHGQGLRAWERFGADVKAYLESQDLWNDFGDYQRQAQAERQTQAQTEARARLRAAPDKTAKRSARRSR